MTLIFASYPNENTKWCQEIICCTCNINACSLKKVFLATNK